MFDIRLPEATRSRSPLPTATINPPPKYSRYRSVRRAANSIPEPPPLAVTTKEDDGPKRSMSRYRRSRIGPATDQFANSPPIPPMPELPRAIHSQSGNAEPRPLRLEAEGVRRVTDPVRGAHPNDNDPRRRETETDRARRKVKERQLRIDEESAAAAAESQRQKENEEGALRLLAEQKRKDLERLEAELDAAAPLQRVSSPRDKLKFFSRKRGLTKTTPPLSTTSGSVSGTDHVLSNARTRSIEQPTGNGPPRSSEKSGVVEGERVPDVPPLPESAKSLGRPVEPARGIEAGSVAHQTDAPISASNAGERRVLIRCRQSSINLPINPETTPVELIYSAANIMNQNISTASAILLESYTQLGLERRIRRYEHVRDIMNSWDRDTQNALILQSSDSPAYDVDLDVASVPKEAPADITVHMFHSQKPGKWNRRYITLQSSGQIFIARKSGAKHADKDVVNICHLSDFDIYTPTPQQLRKTLKPPKKHCYAIKSQQKTTMFLSTENFVHFFCTDDLDLSVKWYDAVQQWRSWYLVNRLGEGRRAAKKPTQDLTSENSGRPGTKAGHSVKVSVDENPYTIGSFQPLNILDRFGSPSQERDYDSDDENRPRQIPFHLRNSVSTALPSKRESKRHPPPVNYKLPPEAEGEFASNGLLGRTYTQRQKALNNKEREMNGDYGPFMDGPSLLNGPLHQRTQSIRSTQRPDTSAGTGGLQRGNSQRKMPKPLLDFTPTFREAPQWDNTGKGHGVKPIEGVPLVEVARGPGERIGDPGLPQTVFRRDQRPFTAGGGKEHEGAFVKGGLVSGL